MSRLPKLDSITMRTGIFGSSIHLALILSFCVLTAKELRAQAEWQNTSGTPDPWYDEGDNWSGFIAPAPTDPAHFSQDATYQVWWDGVTASTTPEVGYLRVQRGNVTFLNQGGGVQHLFTVNGNGSFNNFSISGVNTTTTIRGLHIHSLNKLKVSSTVLAF